MKRKESTRKKSSSRGRPKGSVGRSRKGKTPAADRADPNFSGETPLNFLLDIMNDPNAKRASRIDAAGKALPYMHRRKPVSVEVDDGRHQMSEEELQAETRRLLAEIRSHNNAASATQVATDDDDDS